ncbi:MAG: TRAP transporter small permease [Thermodesulfobacteriota bacterium]
MIVKGIRIAESVLGTIGALMLWALMFLGTFDVIGRYLFNRPLTGALETSLLLMGGTVFFSWAYTMEKGDHVTVDILFAFYPRRVRAVLSFLMMFLSLVLFSLVLWQSVVIAMSDWKSGRLVEVVAVPVAPFKLMVPLGAALVCLECLVQMARLVPGIFRKTGGS